MEWTPESKLRFLLGLNWTVTPEKDHDEGYTILRVAELPSVIATGDDIDALEKDFWESLRVSLEAALEFGDSIQLPRGVKAPWEQNARPTPVRNLIVHGNVQAHVPQAKQTGSQVPFNQVPKELAIA